MIGKGPIVVVRITIQTVLFLCLYILLQHSNYPIVLKDEGGPSPVFAIGRLFVVTKLTLQQETFLSKICFTWMLSLLIQHIFFQEIRILNLEVDISS